MVMDVYLPIANLAVNGLVIVALGAITGLLSGVFGVGGGFLTTPLLIFYGIPPTVAAASAASQVTGASVSGVFAHFRRGGVDVHMGLVLVAGGVVGSIAGALLFRLLQESGQIDVVIGVLYVVMLSSIGGLMLHESVTAVRVDGGHNQPSTPDSADGEVMLDIEVAAAVAPKARIAVYFAPNTDKGFLDAITQAIHDKVNQPSVISISWGAAESNWTPQSMHSYDQAFQAAAALGVTVCAAAGDNGELEVDAHLQTSIDGLYALGDVVVGLNQIGVAMGHAAIAATAVHNRLPRNWREAQD